MTNKIVRADDPVVTAEELVRMRAENQGKRARIDKFLEQYGRFIVAGLIAMSTWFMGHVISPLAEIPAMVRTTDSLARKQAKQDSLYYGIMARLDHADQDRSKIVDILGALAAIQCEQFTPREKLTSSLCHKLTVGDP